MALVAGAGPRTRLVGRTAELRRIEALLDGVAHGRGGALRIDGSPGTGKTALLAVAADAVGDVRCVPFAATEGEVDLPLAALDELLLGVGARPVRGDPAQVVREAAQRLASAAPLLLLVDDVQWLDASSRLAVEFVARRAHRLGVGVLATWSLRGDQPDAWTGVEVLRLGDLPREDALALAVDRGLAPPVAEALVEQVGGLPLALVEAPEHLDADQRAGRALLPEPLPVGARLGAAFGARLAATDDDAREALLLLAAGAPADALEVEALEAGEAVGLLTLGDSPGFVHPLARSAVLQAAGPAARRSAHRAVAALVDEPERSWQLALAAPGADEVLAARLEALAQEAREHGAPGTAASALERAARMTPDPARAAVRRLDAARTALVAGRPARAVALVEPLGATASGVERADVALVRGAALAQTGRPREASTLLERAADELACRDAACAAALLVQACVALLGPGPMERVAELADRALAIAPRDARALAAVAGAEARVALGDHALARELLDEHEPALAGWDPTGPGHEVLAVVGLCRLWLGDHERAEAALVRLVDADRAAGAASVLALPLAALAALRVRQGRLPEAAAHAVEAAEIAETGLGGFGLAVALSSLALVAAQRGEADVCLATADRLAGLASDLELTSSMAAAEQARGHLALGAGDASLAATHLTRALDHQRAHGTRDPAFLFTHADLVEALARAGDLERVEVVLADLEDGARRTGGAWAAAAVERCRLLLGPDTELDARLASALECHAAPSMPFEAARTRLVAGEQLRRARRRVDAREQLAAAHDAFAAMGAVDWARRARRELDATARTSTPANGNTLTPREHAVCERVAAGATNREVAAALFVSVRTVEHHLRLAYAKLGVRSRSELAARWPITQKW